MLVCGQYNQYATDLPRVCFQPTPIFGPTVTEAGNGLQEPGRLNMASSQQLSFPRAPWLPLGQTASSIKPDLQPVLDRRGLLASQEKASLLVYHGSRELSHWPTKTPDSTSCSLSNIAFDYSNFKQLDSIFQWRTQLRNLLLVQWENISLDQMDKWLASYSTGNSLLTSCHIPGTYL